jgi:hypothetical protein
MGGDDSQKLLPWRGMLLLSGAQLLPLQRRINTLSQRWARVPKSESSLFLTVGAAVLTPTASSLETSRRRPVRGSPAYQPVLLVTRYTLAAIEESRPGLP